MELRVRVLQRGGPDLDATQRVRGVPLPGSISQASDHAAQVDRISRPGAVHCLFIVCFASLTLLPLII